jgi:hypothetical protein
MWDAAMRECQIYGRDLTTGDPVPLGKAEWVITSSSNSPWRNSFKVERHLRPAFEQTEVAVPAAICLFGDAIKDQGRMEWRIAGSPLHGQLLQPGDVSVLSEGTPVWADHLGPSDITQVVFSPDFLATAACESIPRGNVELKTLFLIQDQQIRALGSLLQAEAKAGCPTGRIYGESLGVALAAHVLRRYAVFPPRSRRVQGWPLQISAAPNCGLHEIESGRRQWSSAARRVCRNQPFPLLSIVQAEHRAISAPVHTSTTH